jgi:uncharacterized damage-inducible protein DinB
MNIIKLAEYNIWANNEVRDVLETLTEEEFSKEIIPPFNSIKQLCLHSLIAIEFNLKRRIYGINFDPYELRDKIHRLSQRELMMRWKNIDNKLLEFASSIQNKSIIFPNFLGEGEIRVGHEDYVIQYVLHTLYHRAQIMSALRILGKEGKTTDYLFYLSHLAKIR